MEAPNTTKSSFFSQETRVVSIIGMGSTEDSGSIKFYWASIIVAPY